MREDALSMLRSLVGHKVVAIRPGAEAEDVDFVLIFDDGRTLECYFTPGGGWSVGRDVDGDITPVFRQPAGAVAADQVSEAANHAISDAYIPKEPSDAAARAALDIIGPAPLRPQEEAPPPPAAGRGPRLDGGEYGRRSGLCRVGVA